MVDLHYSDSALQQAAKLEASLTNPRLSMGRSRPSSHSVRLGFHSVRSQYRHVRGHSLSVVDCSLFAYVVSTVTPIPWLAGFESSPSPVHIAQPFAECRPILRQPRLARLLTSDLRVLTLAQEYQLIFFKSETRSTSETISSISTLVY